MSLSIIHGGHGPVFFSPTIIDYLFGGISSASPCIDDIPDTQVQSKIRKVMTCFLGV